MPRYCIVEIESGWTVIDHPDHETAEEAARRVGGMVVDPGPYADYEEACDALVSLQQELDLEDNVSDVPGTRAMEGRPETHE